MGMNKNDLPSEVIDISQLEENQVVLVEVISDTRDHGRDDGFGTGQIFENTGGSINFSENASAIRDNADVRLFDGFDNFLETFGAQVMNRITNTIIRY